MLELKNVTKRRGKQLILNAINLDLNSGEILSLIGPSGCGKTTLLRLIAGHERLDDGQIHHQKQLISTAKWHLEPEKRGIHMVFQNFVVFPHLTVQKNIAFGLSNKKLDKAEAERHITDMLALTGLTDLAERYPSQLSGGEQQRVALGRALVGKPAMVLLDEPFSNLDPALRRTLRDEVRHILKKLQMTAVFVTHDQEDALNIGDRIALLSEQGLVQVDDAQTILERPQNRFAAEFFRPFAFVSGVCEGNYLKTELGKLALTKSYAEGAQLDLLIRPTYFKLADNGGIAATVLSIGYMGIQPVYRLELDSGYQFEAAISEKLHCGQTIRIRLEPHDMVVFESVTPNTHAS